MPVPPYHLFIEPVLRFLARHESSVTAGEAHDAAARALGLTPADMAVQLPSGGPVYKSRAGWAFSRLKRAGLAVATSDGVWKITDKGRSFENANPTLTNNQVAALAMVALDAGSGVTSSRSITRAGETDPKPLGDRKAYRLQSRPLAAGGQAHVYEAIRKTDNKVLVLKRVRDRSGDTTRMRREIEIQSSLINEHIMPILDWDATKFTWYVMPRGGRTMADLTRPVPRELLCVLVNSVASALEVAHKAGHPHRDVKPSNIIELSDAQNGQRWVLADWGLTRRPLGETTAELTRSGYALGTDGYAPPEAYRDPHNVGPPGDIYSLGQVIAWATGVDPIPNVVPNVSGPWSPIVEAMTRLNASERIQSVVDLRLELESLCDAKHRPPEENVPTDD
jgi:Mrr restriction endonuclease-like protein/protein kinase-like protein